MTTSAREWVGQTGQFLKAWFISPNAIFCGLMGAVIAVLGTMLWYSARPPGQLMTLVEDDGVAVAGGRIVLVVHLRRDRFCASDTQRWLVRQGQIDGEEMPVWRFVNAVPGPPTPIGDDVYALELDLPPGIEPGDYRYISRTAYRCGLLTNLFNPPATQSPPLAIRVLALGTVEKATP